MTKEEVKEYITAIMPAATYDESGEWLNINITSEEWRPLAVKLKNEKGNFNYLFCVTCIDWRTHFTMVYHLSSTDHRNTIVVKAKLDKEFPVIETVCDLWRTAEFHEREAYDLFGVTFKHHPDLRRLVLTDDFVGYPLRKDFEDPINMIRL